MTALDSTTISVGATITKGIVFDIKKYATDDGPGIRTTVFLKGCPLRCSWCHNPEGQVPTPELMYKRKRCIGCFTCSEVCPRGAVTRSRRGTSIDRKLCDLCGECSATCPTDAIGIVGKEMTVSEVVEEVEKDAPFYEDSKGGVTFSGGEPLMQLDFLSQLIGKFRERNIHVAVDTCGYAAQEAFDKILGRVDVFLFDLKIMDDKKHIRYTGVSNKPILQNFKRLAENEASILVRFPVVPGVNDEEQNVTGIARFIRGQGVEDIDILPYHRAGVEKYKSLGRTYRLKGIRSPSDDNLKLIKEKLQAYGLSVKIGGG